MFRLYFYVCDVPEHKYSCINNELILRAQMDKYRRIMSLNTLELPLVEYSGKKNGFLSERVSNTDPRKRKLSSL